MSFIHHITHSCREAQKLIIQKEEQQPIALVDRLRLKLHIMFCTCCHRFVGQNKFIDKVLKQAGQVPHVHEPMRAEKKQELQQLIDKNMP